MEPPDDDAGRLVGEGALKERALAERVLLDVGDLAGDGGRRAVVAERGDRLDVAAEVDMNVVMTGDGRFIEIQGTGEKRPFTAEENAALLDLARKGADSVTRVQEETLREDAGDAE